MMDRVVIDATALDFTDCPARFAAKPKSCDQLRIWLQTRIDPGRISRVTFGPIDQGFHQGFCAVVVECCPNIQHLKFGIVGGEVPLQQEIARMPRMVSLHIDMLHVDYLRTREDSLSDDLSKMPLPSNLLALTVRNRNIIAIGSSDWEAHYLHALLERCQNLKYVHADAADRCVDFIKFRRMGQLEILRLRCGFSFDFEYENSETPKLRCLEFQRSQPEETSVGPLLFDMLQNSADRLETLSFVDVVGSAGEIFFCAAKFLTALKRMKIAIANDANGNSIANFNALMAIFVANPRIEWLVLEGLKLPWDFIGRCVRICTNLQFICVSFPGDFTVEQADLVKADLQSLLKSRIWNAEHALRIYLPNFTRQLLHETGLKELFDDRKDVKFGNNPNPQRLKIEQFIEKECFGIF